MVAKPRTVHRDGIRFQGLRYLDPALAPYVGRQVTIRYDPRDVTEIRVFHRDRFLCRAISPEHAGAAITLKDIQAARAAHRRDLREQITLRRIAVAEYLPIHAPEAPAVRTTAARHTGRVTDAARPQRPGLHLYQEDRPTNPTAPKSPTTSRRTHERRRDRTPAQRRQIHRDERTPPVRRVRRRRTSRGLHRPLLRPRGRRQNPLSPSLRQLGHRRGSPHQLGTARRRSREDLCRSRPLPHRVLHPGRQGDPQGVCRRPEATDHTGRPLHRSTPARRLRRPQPAGG